MLVSDLFHSCERRISRDRLVKDQAIDLTVLCSIGKSVLDGVMFIFQIDFLSANKLMTGDMGTIAPAEKRHGQLGTSCALQAGESDDLALVYIERYVIVDALLGVGRMVNRPVLYLESDFLADVVFSLREAVGHLTSNHSLDDTRLIDLVIRVRDRLDRLSITKNRDIVRAVSDLIELV